MKRRNRIDSTIISANKRYSVCPEMVGFGFLIKNGIIDPVPVAAKLSAKTDLSGEAEGLSDFEDFKKIPTCLKALG